MPDAGVRRVVRPHATREEASSPSIEGVPLASFLGLGLALPCLAEESDALVRAACTARALARGVAAVSVAGVRLMA